MRQQGGIQEHETYPVSTHEEYVEVAGSNGSMCLAAAQQGVVLKLTGVESRRSFGSCICAVFRSERAYAKEVHGMPGMRLAVRAARTLVARTFYGKLLRVVILQGDELKLLADGEDGA